VTTLPPGFGYAIRITTSDGTVLTVSSTLRGFYGPDDRFYEPAVIRAPELSGSLQDPSIGFPVWGRLVVSISNIDWRGKAHLTVDRLEGANVELFLERGGTFVEATDVLKTMSVRSGDGVSMSDSTLRLTCIDLAGFYLENAFLPKRTLDEFSDVKNATEDEPALLKGQGEFIQYVVGSWSRGSHTIGPLAYYQSEDSPERHRFVVSDTHNFDDSAFLDQDYPNALKGWDIHKKPAAAGRGISFVDLEGGGGNEFHILSDAGKVPESAVTKLSDNEGQTRINVAAWNNSAFWSGGGSEEVDTIKPANWVPGRFELYGKGDGTISQDVKTALDLLYSGPIWKNDKPLTHLATLYHDILGVPLDRIDLTVFDPADSVNASLPDTRRRVRTRERLDTMVQSLLQESRLLQYETGAGKISWRLFDLSAPPPIALSINERHILGELEYRGRSFGEYFNCASCQGDEGTGFAFDEEHGRSSAEKKCNDDAVADNGGVEVHTSLEVRWLWKGQTGGRNYVEEYRDYRLFLAQFPNDTIRIRVRMDVAQIEDQIRVIPGDTVEFGYKSSNVAGQATTIFYRQETWLVLEVKHNLDTFESVFVLWKFGGPLMHAMDAGETFPAEIDAAESAMDPWDTSWTRDQKKFASRTRGGYASETKDIIIVGDPDPDLAQSPAG